MKTVNRGPQSFLGHKIIHRAKLINLIFLLLPHSSAPFTTLPLQTCPYTLCPPHAKTKQRATLNAFSPLKQKMARAYEKRFCSECPWRWKSIAEETPRGPGWRCECPQRDKVAKGAVTKKMRQTAHSWFWDAKFSQYNTLLLDLCVCVWITGLLLDHKNRGMILSFKKRKKQQTSGEKHM